MPVEKIVSTTIGKRYVTDIPFRGGINIYQGLSINLIYATVHVINGIISRSAWFISLVLYYLILGLLRVYLAYKLSQGNHRQGCLILSNSYDRPILRRRRRLPQTHEHHHRQCRMGRSHSRCDPHAAAMAETHTADQQNALTKQPNRRNNQSIFIHIQLGSERAMNKSESKYFNTAIRMD